MAYQIWKSTNTFDWTPYDNTMYQTAEEAIAAAIELSKQQYQIRPVEE